MSTHTGSGGTYRLEVPTGKLYTCVNGVGEGVTPISVW